MSEISGMSPAPALAHQDAEKLLLGAALTGVTDLDDLLDSVAPDDFSNPWGGDVWDAIARVHRTGTRPDPTSVRLALMADVDLDDKRRKPDTSPTALFDLAQSCDMPWNAPVYAEAVVTAAGLRRLQVAGIKVKQLGDTHGDLDERREQARQAVDEACRGKSMTRARKMSDALPLAIEAAESSDTGVLSTCWPDIDRTIGGIAPGRLVVFGARPGGGKSLAGTNLAAHVAGVHGHAVLLASLEMPELEVVNRILSSAARVDLSSLNNGNLSDADWERIAQKQAALNDLPLYIDDTADLSVQQLRAMARNVQRERDDLALIVVDYLQLMRPAQRRREASRSEEVSGIARDLKLLARETGACVVAMAQVNREGAKTNEGPRLIDLREGGAENDADQVILLHRKDPDVAEVTATVAKNRHGPQPAESTLLLLGQYATLGSLDWRSRLS